MLQTASSSILNQDGSTTTISDDVILDAICRLVSQKHNRCEAEGRAYTDYDSGMPSGNNIFGLLSGIPLRDLTDDTPLHELAHDNQPMQNSLSECCGAIDNNHCYEQSDYIHVDGGERTTTLLDPLPWPQRDERNIERHRAEAFCKSMQTIRTVIPVLSTPIPEVKPNNSTLVPTSSVVVSTSDSLLPNTHMNLAEETRKAMQTLHSERGQTYADIHTSQLFGLQYAALVSELTDGKVGWSVLAQQQNREIVQKMDISPDENINIQQQLLLRCRQRACMQEAIKDTLVDIFDDSTIRSLIQTKAMLRYRQAYEPLEPSTTQSASQPSVIKPVQIDNTAKGHIDVKDLSAHRSQEPLVTRTATTSHAHSKTTVSTNHITSDMGSFRSKTSSLRLPSQVNYPIKK